jgi:hypothetical protein
MACPFVESLAEKLRAGPVEMDPLLFSASLRYRRDPCPRREIDTRIATERGAYRDWTGPTLAEQPFQARESTCCVGRFM